MEILVSIQEFVGYDARMVILVYSHSEHDGGHGISCEFCCFLSEGAKVSVPVRIKIDFTACECVQQVC